MTSWICAQIGAREHYAVPRALHQAGRLCGLYTDFWADTVWRKLVAGPASGPLRSLAARFHTDLADAPVTSWNLRSFSWEASSRFLSHRKGAAGKYKSYLETGSRFACAVRDALRRQRNLAPETVFFAYDTGALETLEWIRERGFRSVLDQMDPNRVEVDLVREEEQRWPGWRDGTTEVPEEYFQRREQEWELADRVMVNSEFSKRALIAQGVPQEKLVVVPLCYEGAGSDFRPASCDESMPLRVLWLGQVILRKGIQYLLEAARQLAGEKIRFDVVGPIGISPDAVASAPANVTFHGRASRDQIGEWYAQADVFVLPTISDGFALTQLEAMAHGLPVIATPNCGDVVRHETDGLIIPVRDAQALAKAILRYRFSTELLRNHQAAAPAKANQFRLAHLAGNLSGLEVRQPNDDLASNRWIETYA